MNSSLLKIAFIIIQSCLYNQVKSQTTSYMDKYHVDTLSLSVRSFPKTVAYQYHSIVFYVDYNSFKQVVINKLLSYQPYRKSTYEATLKKLNSDIKKSDTVCLTQNTFDSVEIIPFDSFLIQQIENNNCVIRDANNNIQTEIIRVKETKYYKPGIWGGRTYYLKGAKEFFIQLTDIVS